MLVARFVYAYRVELLGCFLDPLCMCSVCFLQASGVRVECCLMFSARLLDALHASCMLFASLFDAFCIFVFFLLCVFRVLRVSFWFA